MSGEPIQRWWNCEDASTVANEVGELCKSLEADFAVQRAKWRALGRMYEPQFGDATDEADEVDATLFPGGPLRVNYPIARSLVDTVVADIAGRQRPKPLFMTTGADWRTQRRAKKRGRFVVGQMSQDHDGFLDAWEAMEEGERKACVYGIDWTYVYGDPETGRVRMEHVPVEEMLYDCDEARNGDPANLFRVRRVDEDELLSMYVSEPLEDGDIDEEQAEVRRAAIAAQHDHSYDATTTKTRVARQVRVYEAWHLPLCDDDGRHVLAVGNVLLVDEEWERHDFPFLVMRWARELDGFGGIGIVEEAYSMAVELNAAIQHVQEQHTLNAGRRIYYTTGSVDEVALQSNEVETLVAVEPNAQLPQETVVPAINPSSLQWVEFLRSYTHEGVGVSQMAAQGRKEPGVTSGVAIRTVLDMATKRFALKARAYENSYIRLSELFIASARDLKEMGVEVRSRVPDSEFLDEYSWADVESDDEYTIQIDAVSAQSDSASGRLATMQEAVQSGFVSPEAFSRVAPPNGTLDIEDENGPIAKQQRYMAKLIDTYLDAEETDRDFVFEGPDGFILDPSGATRQWIGAYFDSKYAGAPEFNLQLLRDYIQELDRIIQRAAQAMQAAQMPPGGPPGMAPPGPQGPPIQGGMAA